MDIDIPVPAGLNLLRGHEKFLIQFLVQLIEHQAPLGGHKRRVRIGVLLVPDIHDGLALLVHIVQHPHKVLLVIAVVPITLGHHGLYLLQSALHDIMHHGNGNLVLLHLIDLINNILADTALVLRSKLCQSPVGALGHRIDHLLYIEVLPASVLLYHPYFSYRSEILPVIHFFPGCLIKITAHISHSLPKQNHCPDSLPAAWNETCVFLRLYQGKHTKYSVLLPCSSIYCGGYLPV